MKLFQAIQSSPVILLAGIVALGGLLPRLCADTQRQIVQRQISERPTDPWPRGAGHVVFAEPGTPEEYKGYLEPGGSFSPAFGSFGISIWITDDAGRLVTTSDRLDLSEVNQRFGWPDKRTWPKRTELPDLLTRTPYYDAVWSSAGPGRWQLRLRTRGTNSTQLVVRSVGPAGAPLASLHWASGKLYVSDRWSIEFNPAPNAIEVIPPITSRTAKDAPRPTWRAEADWGYARFTLLRNQEYFVTIDDAKLLPEKSLYLVPVRSPLKLDLPDDRFTDSLEAQVTHLMMGLVGNETRPGEPNNYPLNWLRDGAYVIVALARSGQVYAAKELCGPFASQDFFGGFGAEADGPGLALWALEETAVRAADSRYDQTLWPSIERKVALILEMLSATGPVRKPYAGSIVPKHQGRDDLDLVCDAARDGLIMGRMDWHRPTLYVNAVSYRGLLSAAELASRLGKTREAGLWRTKAAELRIAWTKGLASSESNNERTYICGLYPTWIVSDRADFESKLSTRRAASHDQQDSIKKAPLWTYFSVAEAHQWLMLGQPEKTWNDLRWFWEHQASPGLFTWWEGEGEENTSRRWEDVRGWLNPPHVTPHYWTAAEMLLLQLDMLAYLDDSGSQPILVVGGGVPKEWLDHSLSVKGLSTRLGRVDWEWHKGRMTVWLNGAKCGVKLGPAFKAETPVKVKG